jgi:antitoxin component of MazEF toxin-antitoxin module
MAEIVVTARKWGNSIGATFPSETVAKEGIKPNDRLVVSVKKVVPIKELFGTFKTKKPTQKIKDELRKGWN